MSFYPSYLSQKRVSLISARKKTSGKRLTGRWGWKSTGLLTTRQSIIAAREESPHCRTKATVGAISTEPFPRLTGFFSPCQLFRPSVSPVFLTQNTIFKSFPTDCNALFPPWLSLPQTSNAYRNEGFYFSGCEDSFTETCPTQSPSLRDFFFFFSFFLYRISSVAPFSICEVGCSGYAVLPSTAHTPSPPPFFSPRLKKKSLPPYFFPRLV